MFFNKTLNAAEVASQYTSFLDAPPILWTNQNGGQITLSWSANSGGYGLESRTNAFASTWTPANLDRVTNGGNISVTLPTSEAQRFFRLRKP